MALRYCSRFFCLFQTLPLPSLLSYQLVLPVPLPLLDRSQCDDLAGNSNITAGLIRCTKRQRAHVSGSIRSDDGNPMSRSQRNQLLTKRAKFLDNLTLADCPGSFCVTARWLCLKRATEQVKNKTRRTKNGRHPIGLKASRRNPEHKHGAIMPRSNCNGALGSAV